VSIQASSDKKQLDVGANLFIGNLDENVDERLLYDTFSAFGMMATTAKVCVFSFSSLFLPPQFFENRLLGIPDQAHPKDTDSSRTPTLKPRTEPLNP